MHGKPLARLQGRPAGQRMKGRGHPAAQARRQSRGQAFGQARKVMGMGGADIFGIGARLAKARHPLRPAGGGLSRLALGALTTRQDKGRNHPIPDPPFRQRPGLHHLAAIFMARDGAQFHLGMLAHPAMPIAATNATGQDLQHNPIGFADRIRHGFQGQIGVILTDDGGAHAALL